MCILLDAMEKHMIDNIKNGNENSKAKKMNSLGEPPENPNTDKRPITIKAAVSC